MSQVKQSVSAKLQDLFRQFSRSLSVLRQVREGISNEFRLASSCFMLSVGDGQPAQTFDEFSMQAMAAPTEPWYMHFADWNVTVKTVVSVSFLEDDKDMAIVTAFGQSAKTNAGQVSVDLAPFYQSIASNFAEKHVRLDTIGDTLARLNRL